MTVQCLFAALLLFLQRWLTQIEGLLSTVPTNFAAGNHENAGAGLPDASVPQGVGIPDAGEEHEIQTA
jgi:hypothetical protein